jgi:hypothetical protein
MANVSKLDVRHKLEFLRTFLPGHTGMTLDEINAEIRKRFGRGLTERIVAKERDRVRHAEKLKKGTAPLKEAAPKPKVAMTATEVFAHRCNELAEAMREARVVSANFTAEPITGAIRLSYDFEKVQVSRETVTTNL